LSAALIVNDAIRKTLRDISKDSRETSVLSKKICKKCIGVTAVGGAWWNDEDEDRWSKGRVLCEFCKGWDWSIKRRPPPECPYKLEQAVAAGIGKKK
jgi:hypothetical protein